MHRPIVQCVVFAFVLLVAAAMASPAWSQVTQPASGEAAATAATSPLAESESPPQPPRCRFEDLLRVEVRDRKLAVAMVPPKGLEAEIANGGSVPITVVDSDAIDWRISGASRDAEPHDGRGRDERGAGADGGAGKARGHAPDGAQHGAYTRFTIAPPPDHMPDRWSPLQLTSITCEDELTVIGSGRVGRTFATVLYRQGREMNAAQLTVLRSRRAGVGRPLHDFTAPDLLQLWNNHHRECRMYLVPLLKTIAPRENLLRPRAGDVYRVFNEIPADAAMTQRVAALLPELEAESPAARDAASAKIEGLGPAGVLALLRMDRSDWTPEQTARLGAIVQRQSTLNDPPTWRRDIYFLTDCLDDADPAVRQAALAEVRTVAGHEVEFDPEASSPARLAAAQEILRTLESTQGGR